MRPAVLSASRRGASQAARRQRGAYALEYGLVFPFLFLVIYGSLAFAVVMFMRIDLQHAAEEGARAALQYRPTAGARLQQAVTVANQRTSWMPGPRTVVADLCAGGVSCEPTSTPASPTAVCGDTVSTACQLTVVASYNYAANPIVPPLPGLGFLLPSLLQASATVLVDAKTLAP